MGIIEETSLGIFILAPEYKSPRHQNPAASSLQDDRISEFSG